MALVAAELPVGLVGALAASRGPELFAAAFRPSPELPQARGIEEEDAFHLRLDPVRPATPPAAFDVPPARLSPSMGTVLSDSRDDQR